MTNASSHGAQHHHSLQTHGDTWELLPKERLSIGRFAEYRGFGRAVPPRLGWCHWDKCIPGGPWAGREAGQGEEACLIQKGKRRMKMLLCSQQQGANLRTFIFVQLKKKKVAPSHQSVAQLSPPFPWPSHACPRTGASAEP